VIVISEGEPVPRYSSMAVRDDVTGDVEAASLWAGQSVGLIHDVRPAGDIVRSLVDEAVSALDAARATFSR
jgi:NAD(P)H-dependent flavin oxidoreductase YrpB (nitropropane dioxygenase family)